MNRVENKFNQDVFEFTTESGLRVTLLHRPGFKQSVAVYATPFGRLVAERGIAHKFHFTGFLRGKQVYEMLKSSDVYVMPSVSEPFGISPLEAMQCNVPSIISYQSGCSEILNNVIKTDFWDVDAMADAIYSICTYPAMAEYLKQEGKIEVDNIRWEDAGLKVRKIYDSLIGGK